MKPKRNMIYRYCHYLFRAEFYCDYSKRFSYEIYYERLGLYYKHFKKMYSIVPLLENQNRIFKFLGRKQKTRL
jgi:type I restriction enzyme S subunit